MGSDSASSLSPKYRQVRRHRYLQLVSSDGYQAIRQFGFESAQAFDSVQALCASDTVDLVVCAVAVFSHYNLIKSAIEAGKDVYVEWPLGVSTEEAEELESMAKKKGVRTIVGLQGRVFHIQATVRDLIDSGQIGTPLVTQIWGICNHWGDRYANHEAVQVLQRSCSRRCKRAEHAHNLRWPRN